MAQSFDSSDPRTSIVKQEKSREKQVLAKMNGMANGNGRHNNKEKDVQKMTSTTELMMYVFGTFGVVVAFCWMIIWVVLKYSEV